jgi:chromosome segregation ATPase
VSVKRQLADARSAFQAKCREVDKGNAALQLLEIELNTARKLHSISEENLKLELSALEDRNQKLTIRLENESRSKTNQEEKASKYDRLLKDFESSQLENAKYELQLKQLNDVLESLRFSESASRRSAEEHSSASSMLQKDKLFLEGELRKVQTELDDRSRSIEHAKIQIASLEVKVYDCCG